MGGQFAGMSVNIFSTEGSICRNDMQNHQILGGSIVRNGGSIKSEQGVN